jgi:hypothetical protein
MLDGKKTFIVAIGIILVAVGQFLSGDIEVAAAVNQVLLGLGLGALRIGVNNR